MKRLVAFSATVLTTVCAVVFGTVATARADHDERSTFDRCFHDRVPNREIGPVHAGGNNYTEWVSPYGIFTEDTFRFTAAGTYTIDWWGTRKSVAGDYGDATIGWPLPGERRYMLIAQVTSGRIYSLETFRTYEAYQWFPVGEDSDCLYYQGPRGATFVFSYNDSTLNDNGGAGSITVMQWW